MRKVKDIAGFLNAWAPFDSAESFDNVGILVGSENAKVETVLVALDLTEETCEQAIEFKADLLVTHHPVIFDPLKRLSGDELIFKLAKNKISVISVHTNMDKAQGGVNDALAHALNLQDVKELENSEEMGRIGKLKQIMTAEAFANFVKKSLSCSALRYTPVKKPIRTVAVLGGGGDFCWKEAKAAGADALVTGEGKHHVFLQAREANFCFVDAGHFETERVVCPVIARQLQRAFEDIVVKVANQSSPVIFC